MKVQDVMTRSPKYCGPETNLAAAVEIMWKTDCGALPVVQDGKVAGMITDRDVCVAAGTRNLPPSEITAAQVMSGKIAVCAPGDNIDVALATMARERVRRLPVVDSSGLVGILCLDDLAAKAKPVSAELSYSDVIHVMKAVTEHPKRAAATAA